MIKNFIKLSLTHKNTICFIVTLNYLIRTVSLLLHAHFIKSQLNIRYRHTHFALDAILLWYLDLITATDEKPASHKYDVANGIRIRRALQLTSGNSNRAVIQKEVIESGL